MAIVHSSHKSVGSTHGNTSDSVITQMLGDFHYQFSSISGRDADRVIGLLFSAEINDIKLIVNRIRPDMIRQGQMLNLKDISDILCVDVIGAICDDEQVVISTNNGTPLTGIGTVQGKLI